MVAFLSGNLLSHLERSLDGIDAMLELVSEMFVTATAKVVGDEAPQEHLALHLAQLNMYERVIRKMALVIYSENVDAGPSPDPLISVARALECCGMLTTEIASITSSMESSDNRPLYDCIRIIRDGVYSLFPRARTAFLMADEARGMEVLEAHLRLRCQCALFINALASSRTPPANQAILLARTTRLMLQTSRHLSGIAAHATTAYAQMRNAQLNESILFDGMGS